MAVKLKPTTLWRREVPNRPGVLADTLEPFARRGTNLQVVMGYRYPGEETKAAIEVYPVVGKKIIEEAQTKGLAGSTIPALLIEGDNRPGLGHAIAQSLSDAGINLTFLVAQVIAKKYSAVIGFETEDDSKKAIARIKQVKVRK